MKIKITADSTCDLPQALCEQYGVAITPLYIVKDGQSFQDGVDIFPEDIYAHVEASGELCTTAAVTVGDYQDFFRKETEGHDALIHFTIASGMSACYQNACIAASEVEHVHPFDSGTLSTGISLLALAAAEMAAEGKSVEEILGALEILRDQLDVSFVVDTLTYLRKGGRCSALAAMGANLLSLKPCIEVRDGAMGVGKKFRGSLEKCFMQYIRERLEGAENVDVKRVFITDSGRLSQETRQSLKAEVLKYQPFAEVHFATAGGTICCHCGPKTMGILFFRQ